MKSLAVIALLVATTSPALARSWVTTSGCTYSYTYGYRNCRTVETYIPTPVRDVEQDKRDAIERQKEIEKWEAFCKPTFETDAFGVKRASYAKSGCEFGRSE